LSVCEKCDKYLSLYRKRNRKTKAMAMLMTYKMNNAVIYIWICDEEDVSNNLMYVNNNWLMIIIKNERIVINNLYFLYNLGD